MPHPNTPRELIDGFRRANPTLQFVERGGFVPAPPAEVATATVRPVQRVLQAGGELAAKLAHPAFVPFEKLYRKLAGAGIFTATPQNKLVIELGSFQVPQGMTFAMVDYRFDIYRQSGAAAGDWVPIEARRLSGQIGYDYQIADYRDANIEYQLQPTPAASPSTFGDPQVTGGVIAAGAEYNQTMPPQIGNPFFPPSAAPTFPSAADFAMARATQTSSTGGIGTALLPQRTERLGPLSMPFTDLVRESERILFKAVVFNPVPIPIVFFEVDVTGILMPANVLTSLYDQMVPSTPQGRPAR